jgi:hypothetical protein
MMMTRITLTVRMPPELKEEIEMTVGNCPIPSINQFVLEACREKLARMGR